MAQAGGDTRRGRGQRSLARVTDQNLSSPLTALRLAPLWAPLSLVTRGADGEAARKALRKGQGHKPPRTPATVGSCRSRTRDRQAETQSGQAL